jgi:hypothetical protein
MSGRRQLNLVCALVLGAATPVPANPVRAAPAAPFLRGYQLINVHSGKCLAIAGDGSADGDAAVQSSCREARAQLWRLRMVSLTGLFQVQNLSSGRCLSVSGGDGRVVQRRCDGSRARRWRVWGAEGTGLHIRSAVRGGCLTVAAGSREENAPAVLSTCGPAASRRWEARLIGGTERAGGGTGSAPDAHGRR